MDAVDRISKFILRTNYDRIPRTVIKKAKGSILDGIGVSLAASNDPISRILTKYINTVCCSPNCTIIGLNSKASVTDAALLNGTLAHALDFDDTSYSMGGHPSAPVLPAALALGELLKSSGKNLLTAYVLGVEVESKIGLIVSPNHNTLGWHSIGTLGTLGAGVATAKLLELNLKQIRRTLGIAGSIASGLIENVGTMTKPLHAGLAAEGGVKAGLLAKLGLTSSESILEAKYGFYNLFGSGCRPKDALEKLGDPYEFVEPGIAFKPYPCCTATHAAIDAIRILKSKHEIDPNELLEIKCGLGPGLNVKGSGPPPYLIYSIPKTVTEAKFTIHFTVAVALLENYVRLQHFSDTKLRDPAVQEIMRKVKVIGHPSLINSGHGESAIITLKMKNGKRYTQRVDIAKGNPENPMTEDECNKKFLYCAKLVLTDQESNILHRCVENLEDLNDVSDLIKHTNP